MATSTEVRHLTRVELEAGLADIRASPQDRGTLRLIVRRPKVDEREVIEEGVLDVAEGLVGDNWRTRGYRGSPDGLGHPDMQINIMNARTAALLAQHPDRWKLAGDQLFVDLDLSGANLPPGSRLAIGDAILEVTEIPHLGCSKFVARFGSDAMKFVNSPVGRDHNLRGINVRVVHGGTIRQGDEVRKI